MVKSFVHEVKPVVINYISYALFCEKETTGVLLFMLMDICFIFCMFPYLVKHI